MWRLEEGRKGDRRRKGEKKKKKRKKRAGRLDASEGGEDFLLDVVSAECTISPLPSLFRRLSAAQNTHISCFFSSHTHTNAQIAACVHRNALKPPSGLKNPWKACGGAVIRKEEKKKGMTEKIESSLWVYTWGYYTLVFFFTKKSGLDSTSNRSLFIFEIWKMPAVNYQNFQGPFHISTMKRALKVCN